MRDNRHANFSQTKFNIDGWRYRHQKVLKRFRWKKVYARTKNGLKLTRTCTRSGTYVRRVFFYKERSSLPKHAALSCTICSNMSVAVGALVWTGRSVSSLRRGDEEDTRCCSSVPWDRERSDEIQRCEFSESLSFPFLLPPVFFFPPFSPPASLALTPFNRALFFASCHFFLALKNRSWVYVYVHVHVYVRSTGLPR